MKLILENPFRVLGLPVTASNKQLSKRISELSMFLELGKAVRYDTDFEWLSDLKRSQESIQDAARKIEQPDKKFFHALFWFWDTASADKLALDVLKNGDQKKAVSLWMQVIKGKNLTASNFSSYKNMGTMFLAFTAKGEGFNAKYLKSSMVYANHVLTSDMLEEFANKVSSIPIRIDREKLMRSFVDEVYSFASRYIDKPEGLSAQELLEAFQPFPDDTTRYLKSKFTALPLSNIEKLVDDNAREREQNPELALELAKRLAKKTKGPLAILNGVLTQEDVEVQLIHDKVALEILDCAIAAFNDESSDLLSESFVDQIVSLLQDARATAVGPRAKQRIEENLEKILEIKSEIPDQLKQAEVSEEVEELAKLLTSEGYSGTSGAARILAKAKPLLLSVKATLGSTDELYLNASSSIASKALNLVVGAVNAAMETLAAPGGSATFQATLVDAMRILGLIGNLDMLPEAREHFRQNNATLNNLESKMRSALAQNSSGCFIATAVYGSPNDVQVLRLREFRDRYLLTHGLGRRFVEMYYRLSPPFANWLKNHPIPTTLVRLSLDGIVCIVKRKD